MASPAAAAHFNSRGLHGLHAFIVNRVDRGRLVPQAFSRFARSIATPNRAALTREVPAIPVDDRPRLHTALLPFGRAAAFTALHHRHLGPPVGHVFSVAVFHEARLCGVAIVGRPVARRLDDGKTLEITRVATDGTRNACSALLGAVRREARRRRIQRLVTYTLPSEGGASLRAAGFECEGPAGGGAWGRSSRPRQDLQPLEKKQRWSAQLGPMAKIA